MPLIKSPVIIEKHSAASALAFASCCVSADLQFNKATLAKNISDAINAGMPKKMAISRNILCGAF